MHPTGFILAIQILIIASIHCQLQDNYDINNVSSRVIEQLERNYEANNVSVDFVNVIRELQPENIIRNNAKRDFNRTLQQWTANDTECDQEFSIFVNGLATSELWALKMLDSSSKIPSGNFMGNMKDLGFYDECVSVEVTKQGKFIRGRHCMYTLSIRIPNAAVVFHPIMSICLPAACDSEHVVQIVQNAMDTTSGYHNLELGLESARCSPVVPAPWKVADILAISMLSIVVGFSIFCTICDISLGANGSHLLSNQTINKLSQFSMYANGKRILNTETPPGTLPTIHGLRFFSMCWVILGHEYVILPRGAVINMGDVGEWMSSWRALHILTAPFSVDTFFVISGFLTSYLFLKEVSNGRRFNVLMYYVHRYIRLTPALGALLLLTIFVFPRVGSGALWEAEVVSQRHLCSNNWWPMLLYVQNYVNTDYLWCLTHTWYLAVDMQLFWISPLILYPLAKKPRLGGAILLGFLIASVVTPAVVAAENEFSGALFASSNFRRLQETITHFYVTSYTRAGPWLLGVILGFVLSKGHPPPARKFMYSGWILATSMFAFIFFSYRIFQAPGYRWNGPWEVFYAGFARHIWAFSICWIIYACSMGYGGVLHQFLSLPVFLPFGRISYSIYLVHFIIQTMKVGATRTPEYFSDLRQLYLFFGDLAMCTFGGLIFSLLFESPFLALEKIFLARKTRYDKHGTNQDLKDSETSAKVAKGVQQIDTVFQVEKNLR